MIDKSKSTYLCTKCLTTSHNLLCKHDNEPHIEHINFGKKKVAELLSQNQHNRKKIIKILTDPRSHIRKEVIDKIIVGGYDYAGDISLTESQFQKELTKNKAFKFEKTYYLDDTLTHEIQRYIIKDKKLFGVIIYEPHNNPTN